MFWTFKGAFGVHILGYFGYFWNKLMIFFQIFWLPNLVVKLFHRVAQEEETFVIMRRLNSLN